MPASTGSTVSAAMVIGAGPRLGPADRKTNGCGSERTGTLTRRRRRGRHPARRRAVTEIDARLDRSDVPDGRTLSLLHRPRDPSKRFFVRVCRRHVGELAGRGHGQQAEPPSRASESGAAGPRERCHERRHDHDARRRHHGRIDEYGGHDGQPTEDRHDEPQQIDRVGKPERRGDQKDARRMPREPRRRSRRGRIEKSSPALSRGSSHR